AIHPEVTHRFASIEPDRVPVRDVNDAPERDGKRGGELLPRARVGSRLSKGRSWGRGRAASPLMSFWPGGFPQEPQHRGQEEHRSHEHAALRSPPSQASSPSPRERGASFLAVHSPAFFSGFFPFPAPPPEASSFLASPGSASAGSSSLSWS